jgi:hypothetical protein
MSACAASKGADERLREEQKTAMSACVSASPHVGRERRLTSLTFTVTR